MKTQLKMKVDVYRNLHKNCWSVRSREQHDYGKVVAHANSLVLDDAKFVVSQAGRNRVLKEKKKNVHAVVRGDVHDSNMWLYRSSWYDLNFRLRHDECLKGITYNPYKKSTFFWEDTEEPIYYSDSVIFNTDMKVYASMVKNLKQLKKLRRNK